MIRIFVITLTALLASCGGGGGSSGNSAASGGAMNPTLEIAFSYSETLDKLSSNFSAATISRWRTYDAGFDDYPAALNWSQSVEPINGVYLNYVQPGQGFFNEYPTANGQAEFRPHPPGVRLLDYSALDFTTGQTLEGEFQTFYGIQDLQLIGGVNVVVPVTIITRGILKTNGVAQAEGVQIWEGFLVGQSIPGGPTYNGTPASLFEGRYSFYIIRDYSGGNNPPGKVLEYNVYLAAN